MGNLYSIKKSDWNNFLKGLSLEYDLYGPKESGSDLIYQILGKNDIDKINYENCKSRAIQPIKIFFLPVQEKVATSKESPTSIRKRIIIGPKSCDITALSVLDKVFLSEDFIDPFYKEKRENTILISSDCTEPKESCFCTEVESNPFPEKNFDLNLTLIDDGFLVEAGSEKGKNLVKKYSPLFSEPDDATFRKRNKLRKEVTNKVKEINKKTQTKKSYQEIIKGKYESNLWKELSKNCVDCAACTNICPTCHCFLLIDLADKNEYFKNKVWDSCQYNGFSKMAAGVDPRDETWKRFRNRYFCKYSYKPENFGLIACTGCGRCIEACQGKIDKREVISKLQ